MSKSRVVYDHKSKSALLEALVSRYLSSEMKHLKTSVAKQAETAHPELFGRIALAEHMPNEEEKAVALAICTSMSSEEKLQQQMRKWTAMDLRSMAKGEKPQAALMAYLALAGFCFTELFGFHKWTAAERKNVLDATKAIYNRYSEPG